MQVAATLLTMAAVIFLCIVVHIMINIQKRVAFHKIEKSVAAHLDVEKENAKQVYINLTSLCACMHICMCKAFCFIIAIGRSMSLCTLSVSSMH